ncbi:MAG: hypothetical protein JO102_04760 [Elusimicrobia bacterium]|nr:hypothetical protein [Elusimicrobiota bacterium]
MRRILPAALFLGLVTAACGPNLAEIRRYVVSSPGRRLAVMPFSMVEGQRDIRGRCEQRLRQKLSDLGFDVIERPAAAGATVFGPSTEAPRLEDVRAYGEQCQTGLVLVGRVERAKEEHRGRPPEYRVRRRWVRDASGHRVAEDEQVLTQPDRPGVPPQLDVRLILFETATGRKVWESRRLPPPSEWSLEEAIDYAMDTHAIELAQAFVAHHL